MKLLAIDTSTELASVALLHRDELFCEKQDSQRTHAQFLLPMIDRLMSDSGLQLNQLDGVLFGSGPGSFTGLRIACSIAKGLAYAHDLDLIPVSSLAAIAWSARQVENSVSSAVLAVLDARMNELYWGYFPSEQWDVQPQVTAARLIRLPDDKPIILAGLGMSLYDAELSAQLKSQISSTIELYPNAGAMIQLALHVGLQAVPVAMAQPVYVRNQVTQGATRG